MQIKVSRSILSGEIRANRSKSYTQRAYALAALAETPSVIRHPSWSDDGCAALGVARAMGAGIEAEDSEVRVSPSKVNLERTWSVGESGLSLRMFSPIAALRSETITISGKGSLIERPVGLISEALGQMGVEVKGDTLPIEVNGPIEAGDYDVDGSMSSQLITGLMIAMPMLSGDSTLRIQQLKSVPYVDMTIEIIGKFGGRIGGEYYTRFDIPGNQHYTGCDYTIEADWSGLAFPLVAGAIAGNVTVHQVSPVSLQADRAILEVLEKAGARMTMSADSIHVEKSEMTAFEFDATDCPDLFPPLAILAARCEGITRIRGVHRLTYKESNRAEVIRDEFGKLGVQIALAEDEMIIVGFQQVNGGLVDAHGDHRIAMALTLAGFVSQHEVVIDGAESVAKSYPDFYADMQVLRGRVTGPEGLFQRSGARSWTTGSF